MNYREKYEVRKRTFRVVVLKNKKIQNTLTHQISSRLRFARKQFAKAKKAAANQANDVCAAEMATYMSCMELHPEKSDKCVKEMRAFNRCMKRSKPMGKMKSSLMFHLTRSGLAAFKKR